MAKALRVRIPQPCHEKWSEMTPNEQGVFCKSCQKNVIDFTTKTENEIYEILANASTGMCGRVTNLQLSQPIRKTEVQKSFFNIRAIAASVMTFFSAERIFASGDTAPDTITRMEQLPVYDSCAVAEDSMTAVSDSLKPKVEYDWKLAFDTVYALNGAYLCSVTATYGFMVPEYEETIEQHNPVLHPQLFLVYYLRKLFKAPDTTAILETKDSTKNGKKPFKPKDNPVEAVTVNQSRWGTYRMRWLGR